MKSGETLEALLAESGPAAAPAINPKTSFPETAGNQQKAKRKAQPESQPPAEQPAAWTADLSQPGSLSSFDRASAYPFVVAGRETSR